MRKFLKKQATAPKNPNKDPTKIATTIVESTITIGITYIPLNYVG